MPKQSRYLCFAVLFGELWDRRCGGIGLWYPCSNHDRHAMEGVAGSRRRSLGSSGARPTGRGVTRVAGDVGTNERSHGPARSQTGI